jgi:Lon protease-like protein
MPDMPGEFTEFTGVVRLFPLPNVVLFPHALQPLHIFEPRYRQMVQDALTSDRLIAMVLLKPGWEEDYEGQPAIHDLACLGRIENEQHLADGKFNLILRGLCRVRLEKELPQIHLYRTARARPLPDPPLEDQPELRRLLVQEARTWLPAVGSFSQQLLAFCQHDIPLGALCDMLAFWLPIPVAVKQHLLGELDIGQRARRLTHELQTTTPPERLPPPKPHRKYPPEFSIN